MWVAKRCVFTERRGVGVWPLARVGRLSKAIPQPLTRCRGYLTFFALVAIIRTNTLHILRLCRNTVKVYCYRVIEYRFSFLCFIWNISMISQRMSIKHILLPNKKCKKYKGNMSVPTCGRDFFIIAGFEYHVSSDIALRISRA